MIERINRAVADCLILCAYAQKAPREAAHDFIDRLRSDPLFDSDDVERVRELVDGLLDRLQRVAPDRKGWVK